MVHYFKLASFILQAIAFCNKEAKEEMRDDDGNWADMDLG